MAFSKDDLLRIIDDPQLLEQAYRNDKAAFTNAFREAFPEIATNPIARVWDARLTRVTEPGINWGTGKEWLLLLLFCLLAGTLAKLPEIFPIPETFFYPRNITFVVFPLLSLYFVRRNGARTGRTLLIFGVFITAAVYINLLPDNPAADTLILACIHLAVLSWSLLGIAFAGTRDYGHESRLDFLKYSGDLVVMTALLALAFGIFSAVTVGLFDVIGIRIEEFYFRYIAVYAMAAAPFVSSHLVRTNPQLVNKVSPVIARVFTPLLLVTLTVYLFAWTGSGKDPYNDRDFLFVFNMLLLGVMAVIFFSVTEMAQSAGNRFGTYVLLALSLVTVAVNGVALSAIVYRITSWGITPNRLAVVVSNLLILAGLLSLAYRLFRSLRYRSPVSEAAQGITLFLPLYGGWAFFVTFLFPAMFGFR
jgi:hypothetical protein